MRAICNTVILWREVSIIDRKMIDKSLALDQNPSSELFYNRRSLFSVQSLKTADLALTIVPAFFDKLQLHCLIEISFSRMKKKIRLDTLHFYVGNIIHSFYGFYHVRSFIIRLEKS